MSEDDSFLSRWARRKAEVREVEAAEATAAQQAPEADLPAELEERDRPITEEEIAALPDPDKLEHGADFKPFLRPGVPQALRQRALRRIWRVNPAIGFLDGMNEYDLDYTDAATVVDNLKTAYQVGRGFIVSDEDEEKPDASGQDSPLVYDAPADADIEADEAPAADIGDADIPHDGEQTAGENLKDDPTSEDQNTAKADYRGAEETDPLCDPFSPSSRQPAHARSAPSQAVARRWARFSVPKQG